MTPGAAQRERDHRRLGDRIVDVCWWISSLYLIGVLVMWVVLSV